jgi:two-component system chemotaxis sensor kinase CheA
MAKLFDRYPRLIRDLSRSTGKQIELRIVGKDTEVDKTVLELLADPLIHIMRNSADHGIETPDVRTAAGKPALGIITLTAEHQGNHVRVEVTDDGKGIHADVIGRKAVEKGLVTAEELSQMSEPQIQALVFAPGFSTAEKLSDLSGRGVGMDVVRTNVVKMNGTINVRSTAGKGTCVEILIPLTVAILPAMMVGVGDTLYALPLTSILEIVRPTPEMLHSVNSRPVLQLRNTVMPLIDLRQRLDHQTSDGKAPFAVVVACGAQRAGLIVDRLIGQQEVVIKPLDEAHAGGPFSGATIREDGGVSLILDIALLLHPRKANGHEPLGRAA